MQEATQLLLEFKAEVNTFVWRWKRWDVRADGMVFWQYTPTKKVKESWVTWESALKRQETVRVVAKRKREKDPEKHKLLNKLWRDKNRNRHNQNAKDYYKLNRQKANETKRKRRLERRKTDTLYALKTSVRSLICKAFREKSFKKCSKACEIIGCDWRDFKSHIEAQFIDNMSWDNRDQWHIDHIVPLASAKTPDDVVRLNHYSNLRPLWALDNLKKGAKMPSSVLPPSRYHNPQ